MSLYTSVLKQVLVATDLSSHSDRAIARALQLAAAHGADLDIVHVMEEGLPVEAQSEITAANEQAIREKLAAYPLADKVTVTIDMVVGNEDTDIVERAVMVNADCILLGLHDRLLAENLAIEGTLAETVIGASKVPVLLVHNDVAGPYRSAVVGVDFSPLSQLAIQAAVLVAPEATLHLVHAYEPEIVSEDDSHPDMRRKLADFASGEKAVFDRAAQQAGLAEIALKTVAEPGEPRDVLKSVIAAERAELLVVGTHGRTGLARSILGSVSTDLINARLCDVLVIKS
ncbi:MULTISPECIES: universal stress protein [Rhodomicrobium]|uniref:universal stress protein n=1 Tax=Rhodomicrobium TaxID=1068 RepID=UPI000B4BC386|nr:MULTISPECIES: universal stress protein [Rhodomicrobium]